jgi:hypothetical protein
MAEATVPNLRAQIKRFLVGTVVVVVAAAAIAFVVDWMVFEVRVVTKRNPYGTVTVDHYYAVGEKGGKTEFIFDPPQAQTCVHALFPHAGYSPCWYLSRHPEQKTDV